MKVNVLVWSFILPIIAIAMSITSIVSKKAWLNIIAFLFLLFFTYRTAGYEIIPISGIIAALIVGYVFGHFGLKLTTSK